MIKTAHERIEAKLIANGANLPLYLGRSFMATPGVFPRAVIAPAKGTLAKGQHVKYTDPVTAVVSNEKTLANRALNFVFWVQAQTYDETEAACGQLLKAILDAGFKFKLGTEDWRDEQILEAQGVTCILLLEFSGAYVNPAVWATLDEILMTTEIVR